MCPVTAGIMLFLSGGQAGDCTTLRESASDKRRKRMNPHRQRSRALVTAKLLLAASGFFAIWILRSMPWWFLAISFVTVSVFAADAVKGYVRERSADVPPEPMP